MAGAAVEVVERLIESNLSATNWKELALTQHPVGEAQHQLLGTDSFLGRSG